MEILNSTRMNDNGFVFSLIILCISIQFSVHGFCTNKCHCSNSTLICKHGDLPTYISSGMRELFIEHFEFHQFNTHQFNNVSNILKLDIHADHGDFIPSDTFDQFTNLTYLGLHGKEIESIHPDAFIGLNNLLTLNLSSNPVLNIDPISRALNSENRGNSTNVLPNLLSLSIAKVKTSLNIPVDLDAEFFKSVTSGRNLKYLDISNLNINIIKYDHFKPLCQSVEFLDMRNSIIGAVNYWGAEWECTSLRTLDISGFILPTLRNKFTFDTFQPLRFFCETFVQFKYLERLLANNINTANDLEIDGYFLDMSACSFRLQKVSIAGNRIKWMNMTVKLHNRTKRSISELNFSHNGLEYISPSALLPSENISILDFSNNKLNVMQENYAEEFEKLFWAQTKLRYLNLSYNSLSKIPMTTFSNNILLKVLDISYNNLEYIDFSMNQLVSIEKIIASHNKIHTIEHDIRMELELLLHRATNNNINGNVTFHLHLEGNQLQCSCDKENVRFLEWLHSTEVMNENDALTCILEEDIVDVRGIGLSELKHVCKMQIIRKIALISSPTVLTAVILSVVFVVFMKRRRKRKLMIREVIAQIELGTFPLAHLVFLSHCSEDTDLVLNKIYPELCEHLSEITHSNEPLVCIGDKYFRPGFPLRDEVMHCIEGSSVFVAIISRNFCRRPWCNLEIGEAYDQKKPIIMLMVEHVEKELMDDFLRKIFDRYAHATWKPDDNGGHIEPEWKLFCKSIIQLAAKSIAIANPHERPAEVIV